MNEETFKKGQELLQNIKNTLPELEELFEEMNEHWNYEDRIYRFYHGSFKVYGIQTQTEKIVLALKKLSPPRGKFKDRRLNDSFRIIVGEGTNKEFKTAHNICWKYYTRPMLEAFFHAKFFLEMAVKYGKELEEAPQVLPSGWAALLYLYNLR